MQEASLPSESAMMAIHKAKKSRPPRRDSIDQLSIEELSPDDMGYDGDVEILHPDQYEEPESDFEDGNKAVWKVWPDLDDELAGRLRRLSYDPQIPEPQTPSRDGSDRGRKRRSREMEGGCQSPLDRHTVIEVSEMVDAKTGQPSLKRRKKKPSKHSIAHRLMKKQAMAAWSDSSDKTDDQEVLILSSNSGTPETGLTPAPEPETFDAMDMG